MQDADERHGMHDGEHDRRRPISAMRLVKDEGRDFRRHGTSLRSGPELGSNIRIPDNPQCQL